MNKVLLIGRLTKDCELKHVGEEGNALLNFTLAVQRNYLNNKGEREADFVPVVYWRKSAESIAPYLTKGRLISIFGKINVKSYTSTNGDRRYITQIVAEDIQFIDYSKTKEEAN
ncbi:single-strand DNA-binding protein [Clostridium tetanomorphum]|uniref:Single-stranded DNA-binding protein n=1 Tax=Clostridium tetanomorphum TaxID=1553 RepID=A0A923E586_CLOTT|nr:single-stranded DNA-binding protein [Clostridium tetanomorphum]KAJ51181.1 single-strand DNA binding protein [Clostridium tetanomorphum DSM 665]MBC2396692.1 single-stranded DNA-binding protein [Clostridium tetanomorphum]MBP1866159.1 single-strand DNA-binding protein [Clostridium tetanomorphum]NRS85138.1 single-strand DNA-binding protein [Clostridium tetanomorphum]NRZ98319.1 single-strand DNA-binding protein [Clostridium tetanomorphum]